MKVAQVSGRWVAQGGLVVSVCYLMFIACAGTTVAPQHPEPAPPPTAGAPAPSAVQTAGEQAPPPTAGTPAPSPTPEDQRATAIEDLKTHFNCTDRAVLCIDSCNGEILARYDGASARFTGVDQGSTIRVRIVGYCQDDNAKYLAQASYRSNPSSLFKSQPPTTLVDASSVPAGTKPKSQSLFDVPVTLAGERTDYFADVVVTRVATTNPKPLDGMEAFATRITSWTEARAEYIINHGRYYIDFGVGMAVTFKGRQTIDSEEYRGDKNDVRLATEMSSPLTPLFSAFIYPGGHVRDRLSPFGFGCGEFLRNAFVIQAATELSRQNLLKSVYVGAGLELVSGVNFVMGAAFVPVTVYRTGARPGLAVDSDVELAKLTREVGVWRAYMALSISTEIFTATKSAFAQLSGSLPAEPIEAASPEHPKSPTGGAPAPPSVQTAGDQAPPPTGGAPAPPAVQTAGEQPPPPTAGAPAPSPNPYARRVTSP